MTTPSDDAATVYLAAATTFADLVTRIDRPMWDQPGLGVWDVRALVGHTSRALTTVLSYLDQPADAEVIDSPERYYALAARGSTDPAGVAERGRRAGEDLGSDPGETLRRLAATVRTRLAGADLEALITTIGGGMRVRSYLPTRTFELVVHSIDISTATGIEVGFPIEVLERTTELAVRIAVIRGDGRTVLSALTGRHRLPDGFSVVA